MNVNQFVESMKRLYANGKVSKDKIVKLYESGKISEEEMKYILDVKLDVEFEVR